MYNSGSVEYKFSIFYMILACLGIVLSRFGYRSGSVGYNSGSVGYAFGYLSILLARLGIILNRFGYNSGRP